MNPTASGDKYLQEIKLTVMVYRQNGQKKNDDVDSSYGDSYAPGDLIGIAIDATNSKIYFSKNGVGQNSGDPTSGSTGTGAAFTISTTPTDGTFILWLVQKKVLQLKIIINGILAMATSEQQQYLVQELTQVE